MHPSSYFAPLLREPSKGIVAYMISLAHQYEDSIELTGKAIREFISKIIVYKPDVIEGSKKQRVRIVYNGVGEILLPGQSGSA
ncbi:MAG: DUF4368 domain-containing protein [Clostridiales bacterium]|nr:DUF4368 domain-containing protein [Clostridiales bacterium]